MYVQKLRLRDGKRYTITNHDDGTVEYDPPLSDELKAQFADNIRGIAETGKFPGTQTDTQFHNNRGSLLNQLGGDEAWARYITGVARSKGAVITPDHTYISQLAAYPGDPRAFIAPGDGRAEIRKLCEERGKTVEGAVNYTPTIKDEEPKKQIRLAEDLVRDRMNHYRQTGEAEPTVSDAELRQMVIEKHGQKPAVAPESVAA